ncbi:MAG TPA: ATP-binding protein [Vicinamibacterales bacterium]|nr:ATP-binding protein [Vicinamibacterales bacterium]
MNRGSLFRRLFTPIAAAVIVLTVTVTALGVVLMRRALVQRARGRVVALAPATRDHIGFVMRAGDHRHLSAVIEEHGGANPDLDALRVLRPNGVIAASSRRAEVGTRITAEHRGQRDASGDLLAGRFWTTRILHSVRPLENAPPCRTCHGSEAKVIGFLDVDVAVNPHITGLTAFGGLSALLGTLYLLAVVGILVPVIGYVVVGPLRGVTAAQRRVERGDLAVRLEPTGTREIDDLMSGFNHMVRQLADARACEAEKQRLEQERAQQLASFGQLAASLAHEFRNPLSSVKAVVEVLAAEAGTDPNADVLRAAAGELDRIDQILKDLLQYARPRQPARVSFDLNMVVAEVTSLAFPPFASGAPRVRLEPQGELPPVLGDPDLVRQVVVNLLLNAAETDPHGDNFCITLQTGRNGSFAWCRVSDNGPGVPAEAAAKIFQPFVTSKLRGTGLGLPTSRRLIELQGGALSLENPGQPGASFLFTVPFAGKEEA